MMSCLIEFCKFRLHSYAKYCVYPDALIGMDMHVPDSEGQVSSIRPSVKVWFYCSIVQ